MATATSFSADTSPAYIEFSLLESWLASPSALQLPLHQIESLSSRPKGARSNAYFFKPTCNTAATEMWDQPCNFVSKTGKYSTLIAGWAPAP